MSHYTIDRFEGHQAILTDNETGETTKTISRSLLPANASEGDILHFDGKDYHIDQEQTARALKAAQSLLESLTHGK
ncbi:MAG: DUF3006 domain-containing protein [Eubacteriaceae bacterium]|nr:DUF3006 domain-containing protein [Eubacteriaceae bacterium]MDD4508918.1 DUF3006 domain-containing protein [Eubacteriaceae bacterium]